MLKRSPKLFILKFPLKILNTSKKITSYCLHFIRYIYINPLQFKEDSFLLIVPTLRNTYHKNQILPRTFFNCNKWGVNTVPKYRISKFVFKRFTYLKSTANRLLLQTKYPINCNS
jgi:hypothetical protein